jgi:hypothetical protein
MTREELFEMAAEVGILMRLQDHPEPSKLERFAALVAAAERAHWEPQLARVTRAGNFADVASAIDAEREACAQVCEKMFWAMDDGTECADAIRARSKK